MFVVNPINMAHISLKKVPDDIHRDIKRLQLTMEEKGDKKSLEDLYVELIKEGLKTVQHQILGK
jgi:uncharacterized protein YnzC (UPF0291/DUF896 family)